jgi:hypothetical protein
MLSKSREKCRVFWLGDKDPKLKFRVEALRDGEWIAVAGGEVRTQVFSVEEQGILEVLLERLLDRLEPAVAEALDDSRLNPQGQLLIDQELLERLAWFGPEMAEEY